MAIAPVAELQVFAGKDEFLRGRNLELAYRWEVSADKIYARVLGKLLPGMPPSFFEKSLEVICRKDEPIESARRADGVRPSL